MVVNDPVAEPPHTMGVLCLLIGNPTPLSFSCHFAVGVSGGSTGGILLFFNDTQEKEIHRFKLPSLARDMDIHLANNLVATAHYDNHLRVSGMFAKV